MKRIAIDMDDVMADATGRFIEYAQTRLGITITKEQLNHKHDWAEVIPEQHRAEPLKWLHEPNFFRGMKPNADAQEVVKALQEKYEIYVVSAATEFPQSIPEKIEWLNEYFPSISWKNMVFCGYKHIIKADFLIDDHYRNLISFEGKSICFSAPHNLHFTKFERLSSWKEVERYFL